jgi:hypothetical protein
LVVAKAFDTVSLASADSADSGCHIESSVNTTALAALTSMKETLTGDAEADNWSCGVKQQQFDLNIDINLLRNDLPILEFTISPVTVGPVENEPQQGSNALLLPSATTAELSGESRKVDLENVTAVEAVDTARSSVPEDDFYSAYNSSYRKPAVDRDLSAAVNDLAASDAEKTVASEPASGNAKHSAGEGCDESSVARTESMSSPEPLPVSELGLASASTCTARILNDDCTSKDLLSTGMVIDMNLPACSHVSGTSCYKLADRWVLLPAPANIQCLAVSARYVWCVDFTGRVFYSALHGPGLQWFSVTTVSAQQLRVSPSGSLMWRLEKGSVYAATGVTARRQPWGTKWLEVARDVAFISVDESVAWYVVVLRFVLN